MNLRTRPVEGPVGSDRRRVRPIGYCEDRLGDYAYIPAGTVHTEATGGDGVELVFARDGQGGETTMLDER